MIVFNYNGKEIPLRFGMGAWEKFCELQKCEFHEMMDTGVFPLEKNEKTGHPEVHFNPFVLHRLLYAAYSYDCEYNEVTPEISFIKSKEWLDYLIQHNDELQKITKAVADSMSFGKSKKKVSQPKKN